MSMELVDATLRGEDRRLIDAARGWANSPERAEAIRTYQDLTGATAYRAAEIADQSSAIEFREERERQAEIERRRDEAESGAWFAARRVAENNLRLGLAADVTPLERARLGLIPGFDDSPGRDPHAAYGSAAAPAVFASTPGGGLVDLGLQREMQHARAERSFTEAHDDDLIARAKSQSEDGWMKVQISRAHQRRAVEARRSQTAAAASRTTQRAASREYTGTGWPEITRGNGEILAVY
jgi:hypothetical protein